MNIVYIEDIQWFALGCRIYLPSETGFFIFSREPSTLSENIFKIHDISEVNSKFNVQTIELERWY